MITPLDCAFLLQATCEHPINGGGLQIFHTPAGADEDYVDGLCRELLKYTDVAPMVAGRPRNPVESMSARSSCNSTGQFQQILRRF